MDSGFVIALAKQIHNGLLMYKDFDYVRPPFTPIFWNIILKPFWYFTNYVFLIARIFVLFQFILIAFNIFKIINVHRKNSDVGFCLILVLLININPVMPWHTIDGLFFLSFAIRYLHHKRFLLSVIFAFFAAGTKQPFVIPLIFIFLYFLYNWKKLNWRDNYWSITLFLLFCLFIIKQYDLAEGFLYYKSSSGSTLRNFFASGFTHFYEGVLGKVFYALASLSVIFGFIFGGKSKFLTSLKFYVAIVFLYCIIRPLDLFNYNFYSFNRTFESFNYSLFDTILVVAVIFIMFRRKHFIFNLFVIICVWSASISWGYNSILFGFAFFIIIFKNEFHLILKYNFISFILIGLFLCLRVTHTYGETESLPTRLHLIKKTPVCSGIITNIKNIKRLDEAKFITNNFQNCIFVNSMVMASTIYNEYPHRSVWEYDKESPNYKQDLNLLIRNDITYIIDKSRKGNGSFLNSTLQNKILKGKKLVYVTSIFEVYQ